MCELETLGKLVSLLGFEGVGGGAGLSAHGSHVNGE